MGVVVVVDTVVVVETGGKVEMVVVGRERINHVDEIKTVFVRSMID